MVQKRHLPHAPIKEALIDVQVAFPKKIAAEALDSKDALIAERYPKRQTLHRKEFEFGLHNEDGQPSGVKVGQTVAGYRYSSEDERNIAQFRMDGFTFSRLEPYNTWDEMKAEAAKLWKIYADAVSPNPITRVGVRYINVLKLPLNTELAEYLTAPPNIPAGLDQKLGSFLTRLDIHAPAFEAQGFLTQAFEGAQDNYAPIVLDIDVFTVKHFEPGKEEFWRYLDQLRDFKNKVFFESVTEKTLELFQ